MNILIKFLFFFNIFNIFSAELCNFSIWCYFKNLIKEQEITFKIPRKKYTFKELKDELDKKFNENKDKKDCKEFIEKSKKNNYSELLNDYKLLSFNDDYNIDNFTEIDLTDKEEFFLEYSYEIDKKYDFEFYDIEIKDDLKKELAEELKINENEISTIFKKEVEQFNDFLNKKKLFIPYRDIKNVFNSLNFKIINKKYLGDKFNLFANYCTQYNGYNHTVLDDIKIGFSFNCDYFKPIKATIIRRNYNTKQQYGQKIEKEISTKSLNLLDCSYFILENIFPENNTDELIIYKINEYQINNIKDKTSYDEELKKLKNVLSTNEITIDLLTQVDTQEENKKKREEDIKKVEEEQEIKMKEQQKNKCCCY